MGARQQFSFVGGPLVLCVLASVLLRCPLLSFLYFGARFLGSGGVRLALSSCDHERGGACFRGGAGKPSGSLPSVSCHRFSRGVQLAQVRRLLD